MTTKTNREKLEEKYQYISSDIKLLTLQLAEVKESLIEEFDKNPEYESSVMTIYTIPPKKSISWKKIAEKFEPPIELIDKFSTYSKPTYGLRLKKKDDE